MWSNVKRRKLLENNYRLVLLLVLFVEWTFSLGSASESNPLLKMTLAGMGRSATSERITQAEEFNRSGVMPENLESQLRVTLKQNNVSK